MRAIFLVLLCTLLLGCRTNESPEAQVDDLQITAQVKAKLASDARVSSVTNISVNSTNGVVTLSGQVDSAGYPVQGRNSCQECSKGGSRCGLPASHFENCASRQLTLNPIGLIGVGLTRSAGAPDLALLLWTTSQAVFSGCRCRAQLMFG